LRQFNSIVVPKKVRYEIFEEGEQIGRPMTFATSPEVKRGIAKKSYTVGNATAGDF
jgi:hypothetical protein